MSDRPDGDQPVDPWAPGGAMSSWPSRQPEPRAGVGDGRGGRAGEGAGDGADEWDHEWDDDLDDEPLLAHRRRSGRVVAAALLAALAMAATGVVIGGGPSGDTGGRGLDRDDVGLDRDTGTGTGTASGTGAASPVAGQLLGDATPPVPAFVPGRPTTLRPPPALPTSTAPMEIVAVTADGVVTIALPTGRVHVVDTSAAGALPPVEIAVDDGTVLAWRRGVEGSAVFVDASTVRSIDAPSLQAVVPVADGFALFPVGTPGDPASSAVPVVVATDGTDVTVRPFPYGDLQSSPSVPAPGADPRGGLLVVDAGGTYRITTSGTERISTGELVATGRAHLLVRECDEQRRCGLVAVDADGDRRTFDVDVPPGVRPIDGQALSPAGDALLVAFADSLPSLVVLDLVDGSTTDLTLPADPTVETIPAAWTLDGTGVVVGGSRLHLRDLASRSVIELSSTITDVRSVAVRPLATTPLCDLVEVVLPTLVEIRARNDTTVDPPSRSLLEALGDAAPTDLASTIEPLIGFAGSFVSRDQPESLRFENWPSNVQAGVDGLDAYASDECASDDGSD